MVDLSGRHCVRSFLVSPLLSGSNSQPPFEMHQPPPFAASHAPTHNNSLLLDFVVVVLRMLQRVFLGSPPTASHPVLTGVDERPKPLAQSSSPQQPCGGERRRRPTGRKNRPGPRRPRIPASLRYSVWAAHCDDLSLIGRCYVCQGEIRFQSFHVGHVVPVSAGGSSSLENLRPLCALCNGSMGTEHLEEFAARYFGRKNKRM